MKALLFDNINSCLEEIDDLDERWDTLVRLYKIAEKKFLKDEDDFAYNLRDGTPDTWKKVGLMNMYLSM